VEKDGEIEIESGEEKDERNGEKPQVLPKFIDKRHDGTGEFGAAKIAVEEVLGDGKGGNSQASSEGGFGEMVVVDLGNELRGKITNQTPKKNAAKEDNKEVTG